MSGWRLSAGDLDSPHCLGEVEWRRLMDTTFVLGELTCAILLFIPLLGSSNVLMATLRRRSGFSTLSRRSGVEETRRYYFCSR